MRLLRERKPTLIQIFVSNYPFINTLAINEIQFQFFNFRYGLFLSPDTNIFDIDPETRLDQVMI